MLERLLRRRADQRGARRPARDELDRRRGGPARARRSGLGQPVAYTDHEKRLIATHEAGHATIAWLVAPQRRLEVLTIVKRREALGLLAHGDREDVFTRSRNEMLGADPDRDGRPGGRGAVLRRRVDRSRRRPAVRHQRRGADGRRGRHDRHAWSRTARSRTPSLTDTNLVGRVLGDPDGRAPGRGPAAAAEARARTRCSTPTGTWSRRCATRCSSGTSWSAARSPTSSRRPAPPGPAPQTIDLRDGVRHDSAHRPDRLQRRPDVAPMSRTWTRSSSRPSASRSTTGYPTAVVVRFGGSRYAVDMACVAEVVPVPVTSRVPGCPRWLAGVVNWRGRVLAGRRPALAARRRDAPAAQQLAAAGPVRRTGSRPAWSSRPSPACSRPGRPTRSRRRRRPSASASALVLGVVTDAAGPISLLDAARGAARCGPTCRRTR